VSEGAAGQAGVDVHVDGDGDALDVSGQGGEVEGCAFDGVRAVGLLAQQAGRALGGGGLVVEDEVLIAGDLAAGVGQEESEVGVGCGRGGVPIRFQVSGSTLQSFPPMWGCSGERLASLRGEQVLPAGAGVFRWPSASSVSAVACWSQVIRGGCCAAAAGGVVRALPRVTALSCGGQGGARPGRIRGHARGPLARPALVGI
jgi:hypothetical protein